MSYDNYLAQKTEQYLSGCQPEIIGHNEDKMPDYNCEGCHERQCEFWRKYNAD